jgi:uncharacterized membrane protein YbhN (UPF0104 family)
MSLGPPEVSSTPGSKPWVGGLSLILRIALLVVAIAVLRRELDGVKLNDLINQLRHYGGSHIAAALALTCASFLLLGVLEIMALGYVGQRAKRVIPLKTAFGTAFIAHAYSQSVGLAILTGGAVRVRSYSRYELNGADVARMSVFVTVTATIGLLTTGGLALVEMRRASGVENLPVSALWLGVILLLAVVAYVGWSMSGKSEFYGRGNWRVRRPSPRLALAQIGVSSFDWMLAGSVLFAVLPHALGISYVAFLGIYLVAQTAAVISHIPGGLGVFEALIIMLCTAQSENGLSPDVAAALAASLFVYRIIYYVLPLLGALSLSGIAELIRARKPRAPGLSHDHITSLKTNLPAVDAI